MSIKAEVLVVDDNSPDGTGDTAERLRDRHPALRVIHRKGERGLGPAILRGFGEAKGDILLVLDADLSHPPELIPALLRPLRRGEGDIVLASRNVGSGGTKGWPLRRRIVSRGATLLAGLVTGVKDPMSGFFAIRRSVIEGVRLSPMGYKMGLEVLARGDYRNVVEVPYTFRDRRAGRSKLTGGIMWAYLAHLSGLLTARNSRFLRFVRYCIVGAIGTLINLAVLFPLTEWFRLWYILSAAAAFGVAVTTNYILNKYWTFGYTAGSSARLLSSYVKFVVVAIAGLGINLALLYIFVERFGIWYIAGQLASIAAVMLWNFTGSNFWAFRKRTI